VVLRRVPGVPPLDTIPPPPSTTIAALPEEGQAYGALDEQTPWNEACDGRRPRDDQRRLVKMHFVRYGNTLRLNHRFMHGNGPSVAEAKLDIADAAATEPECMTKYAGPSSFLFRTVKGHILLLDNKAQAHNLFRESRRIELKMPANATVVATTEHNLKAIQTADAEVISC
jgi:hypothetical protein